MTEANIYIIASYAKSGSNWTRMVLENYFFGRETPIDIWSAERIFDCIPRSDFEEKLFLPSHFLTAEEIDLLLPSYFREANSRATEPVYYKLHDANYRNIGGKWVFPREVVAGIVYLVRNPMDVVVSFSHHFGYNLDKTIKRLKKTSAGFNMPDKLNIGSLPIRSLTWNEHVMGWLNENQLPVTLVRYEDMLDDPMAGFSKILNGLGCTVIDIDCLRQAVSFCSFTNLKAQEQEKGKAFQAHKGGSFFRKGTSGTWKNVLTNQQVAAVRDACGSVMDKLNY